MKCIIIVILSFFTQSCSSPEPERDYFIGVWKADGGAIIQLKEDGTLVANQVNSSNIFSDKELSDQVDFKGKWEFTTDNYNNKVIKTECFLPNRNTFYFSFDIAGQGMLGSKPPWMLYTFIGDPDDMNKYEFVKQ